MRTLVTFDEDQIRALDTLARRLRISRAELIRRAVDRFLEDKTSGDDLPSFGLWDGGAGDGLAYQEKLRSEW